MKDTYFFSHDYNARNDPKMVKVLMKLGQEGKGVYWDIIEMMYEQGGYLKLSEIETYAFVLHTKPGSIISLISDFDLFKKDEENFWSESVLSRLEVRKSKSSKAKDSINKRWGENESREKAVDCIFYIIKIFNDTESFIKVGVTTESVSRRYSGKLSGYSFELLFKEQISTIFALRKESEMMSKFKGYKPANKFPGHLECLDIINLENILDFAIRFDMVSNTIKDSKGKDNTREDRTRNNTKANNTIAESDELPFGLCNVLTS